METLQAIKTRRSIRNYTSEPISRQHMRQLLEAAMHAPSAANQQAWHFIVIDDRKTLDAIPDFHPYCAFIKKAPAAIVLCGNMLEERFNGMFWAQDCSAATQNLLLAAHSLGLGGVWLAVYPIQVRINGLRKLLNMPEHLIALNIVSLGYPERENREVERYDATKVTWNRF